MNSVNRTLYIPLYGKAYVSRKGILLQDQKAEEIWAAEGFPLKGKSASKWLAYYMGIRSAVFDEWLSDGLNKEENACVLHLGCGMDSRVLRVGTGNHLWYDVDFPAVISERRKYFSESERYHMVSGDVTDPGWMTVLPEGGRALVVMEGISMYLKPQQLRELTGRLCDRFDRLEILMDCYSLLAAKMSKYKNPINDVGVTEVFGMDDPTMLAQGDLTFVREVEMTPDKYVEELKGTERKIFQKLYAGSFSRKLYRMYEYAKK